MLSAVRKTVPLGCALLLLMLTIQIVMAQSNAQGLRWGFEVGDVFEYDCTYYDELSSWPAVIDWSEEVRVEIESLPEIPVNVDSLDDISYAFYESVQAYYANGTAASSSLLWMAWPIGNWPLMTTLLLDSFQSYVYENANVSLTSTVCIVEVDTSSEYTGGGNITMEFLLSNGVVSYIDYQMVYIDPFTQEEMVQSMKLVMIAPSALPVLVTVILGAAMVTTIVVIEIYRRRKTPTG